MTFHQKQFVDYLAQYISIDNQDALHFFEALKSMTIKKGETILETGSICKFQYFILKGLVITYESDDKGKDHVIQIGTENSWIGDLGSYTNERPSAKYLVAAEDLESLFQSLPILEKLFRILFQTAYIKQTERVSMMLISDSENRFTIFKTQFPDLIDRVEWKTIASYLNMSPETLSRIKNK
jgi:CRP-like cAMP-binding protein